jgi:hypothetical protein
MAILLTSCNNLNMQNIPFNGAGRRPAPHPFEFFPLSNKAMKKTERGLGEWSTNVVVNVCD